MIKIENKIHKDIFKYKPKWKGLTWKQRISLLLCILISFGTIIFIQKYLPVYHRGQVISYGVLCSSPVGFWGFSKPFGYSFEIFIKNIFKLLLRRRFFYK